MTIKLKVSTAVLGVAIAVFTLSGWMAHRGQSALIEVAKKRELESYARYFEAGVARAGDLAVAVADMGANTATVKKLFRAGVDAVTRETEPDKQKSAGAQYHSALLEELSQAYQMQRESHGVVLAHFHRAPAISFCRLHDPAKWNDDLGASRPTLNLCNSKSEVVKGIEFGRGGFGVRGVVPVKDKGGHIGSFEIGVGFNPILDDLRNTTGAKASVFIETGKEKVVWQEHQEAGKLIGTYKHLYSTEPALIERIVTEAKLFDTTALRLDTYRANDAEYGVAYLPLKDFSGRQIGVVVIAKDFQEFTTQSAIATRNNAILFVFALLALVLVVLVVLNVLVIKPLRDITDAADAVSTGEVERSCVVARDDEIGALSKSFERMRTSLVKAMKMLER